MFALQGAFYTHTVDGFVVDIYIYILVRDLIYLHLYNTITLLFGRTRQEKKYLKKKCNAAYNVCTVHSKMNTKYIMYNIIQNRIFVLICNYALSNLWAIGLIRVFLIFTGCKSSYNMHKCIMFFRFYPT